MAGDGVLGDYSREVALTSVWGLGGVLNSLDLRTGCFRLPEKLVGIPERNMQGRLKKAVKRRLGRDSAFFSLYFGATSSKELKRLLLYACGPVENHGE
jgi:hypothetical protein